MQTPQPADTSSAPEPESAPDASLILSPSLRGRQRKKNPKYLDYQVSEVYDGQTPAGKRSRKSKVQSHGATDGEEEEREEGEGENEVPKKMAKKRGRKPGAKKTPGRPRGAGQGQNGEGVTENETPKPKRKYTKRMREEEERGGKEEEVEEEMTGARPKRGAARAALKYLHRLAKDELQNTNEQLNQANGDCEALLRQPAQKTTTPRGLRGHGQRRKRVFSSDAEEDEDFVPNAEDAEEEDAEEAQEEEEEEEEEMPEEREKSTTTRTWYGQRVNGLPHVTLNSITVSTQTTKKFRQECHSSWVFPDWVPSSTDWQLLPPSEVESFLPEEQQSVLFSVFREGLKKEEPQRLHRFSSLPSHSERWDSVFFCGGPVWSLEWCPTPVHSTADQYLAVSCHRTMDEQHQVSQLYRGSGLVQIWALGSLKFDQRPDSPPALLYSLAQERGFVWGLKWCPAGAWEPPNTDRQAPLVPRLGLLAVASSLGLVTVYSLPHPQALISCQQRDGGDALAPVFKAKALVTLRLGSFKAPRLSDSGQVLSLDWLQHKPHNLLTIGFYDGHVGVWDLLTRSSLLRVREADGSMTLLPFECFLAHDLPVRHVSFYPASSSLLVTAGEDRFIKTWDLRRVFEPITQQKRNLNTEICWPLFAPGLLVSEEAAYAAYTTHGVHFYDHHMTALFPVPRAGTMWSMAYSDWLNFVATGDTLGEMVLCTLPLLTLQSPNCKRTIERRFPIQFSSLVPLKTIEEEEPSLEVPQTESAEGGRTGSGSVETPNHSAPKRLSLDTYREAAHRYSLLLSDFNLRSVLHFARRPLWKKMRSVESKGSLQLDEFPLSALHKVRFSPNFSSRTWVASGGQNGLVRLFCVQCANIKPSSKSAPETSSEPGHGDQAPPL